jgi:hypothetical protein
MWRTFLENDDDLNAEMSDAGGYPAAPAPNG